MVFCLFGSLGFWEIAIIVLVILLLFGAKKIPELMRGLGKGVKNFKDGVNGIDEETKNAEEIKDNSPAKDDEPTKG
ncbi:MAG: twin-arginine translocase TatA/TatE family subunit [Bacteroidales bacterium]|nr:twin-arginine translocase TatA/TatE family subunit [Bacteroidales bacterium]